VQQPEEGLGRPLTFRAAVIGILVLCLVGTASAGVLLDFYGGGSAEDLAARDALGKVGSLVVAGSAIIALLLNARTARVTELGAWDPPIDKKLSMSRPCATLGGEPSVAEGEQPACRSTQYRQLSHIQPKGTQRPRLQRRP